MDRDVGLVLSGGGAKGAFQAGVWKAMCELGLDARVQMISGTSVGAINAAAFAAIHDPDRICSFWRERVNDVVTPNFQALSFDAFCRAAGNVIAGKAFPFHGLLDRKVIESMIRQLLPVDWPNDAPGVLATTLECRGSFLEELETCAYRLHRFRIDEEPDHLRRVAKILASAAIPWGFTPVEIDGCRYVDGGWDEKGGENTPLTPFLDGRSDMKTLVVVRCNSADIEPQPLRSRPESGMRIVEIRPSYRLCGSFDDLIGMMPDTGIIRDVPFIGSLAGSMEALKRQLRIWSGTFAFGSAYAKAFLKQGYVDGMAVLRRELWRNDKLKW